MSKKKQKQVIHVTHNEKIFLAPDSIRSMAAVHCKIKTDGIAMLKISDCNNSIRIWNDINSNEEKLEMIQKIRSLKSMLSNFEEEIKSRIPSELLIKIQ